MPFSIGQIVCLKSDPSMKGAIIAISANDVITVFIDGKTQEFYPSQLLTIKENKKDNIIFSNYEEFHNYMTATEISNKYNRSLLSLNSGNINYIPYQYRPVLKFIKADQPRILIADSVGVGKTIEAELILKELEARQETESVLIICPKPLITEKKWENELKRFGEEFEALDGNSFRACINQFDMEGDWPRKYKKCIVPYSLFDEELLFGVKNKKKGLIDLDPTPHFDLVIIDEAHHIRNRSTANYKVVNYFVSNATSVIFLTATPIELKSQDLFVLLNCLRPDLFIDINSFYDMLKPNEFINKAVVAIRNKENNWKEKTLNYLREAESTDWGKGEYGYEHDPEFIEIKQKLLEDEISDEDRVRLITNIEQFNTFSSIINRTRRRDIGKFTTRKSKTIRCKFTIEQEDFYNKLLEAEKKALQNLHGNNVAFMMNILQRQASSCIYGMVPLIDDIINRNIFKVMEYVPEVGDEKNVSKLIEEIKKYFLPLKEEGLKLLNTKDQKFENLLKAIEEKQKEENNKIIIFSTFRHTLKYLLDKLRSANLRVSVIHGGVSDEDRRALRKRFMLDKADKNALDIMLFSEVGCEGLDYQFCDYMINYDLPWNPQKIEQRIGRIDRNGQESESVSIVNMITDGTIEQEIYDRCLMRIGIFKDSIGDCEVILGEIAEGIEKIYGMKNLSKKEREERMQQLADNKIREIQENEKLENEKYNLLGIQINNKELEKEIANATNSWLLPKEILLLVNKYLSIKGFSGLQIEEGKTIYPIRMSKEMKEVLLKDCRKLKLKTKIDNDWKKWLSMGEQYITLSFKANSETMNNNYMLINMQHPLVKQAISYFNIEQPRYISIKKEALNNVFGEHYFIVYRWVFRGIVDKSEVKIICDDIDIEKQLETNLSKINNFYFDTKPNIEKWKEIEKIHKTIWEKEKNNFIEESVKSINYKKQSILKSYEGFIKIAESQIEKVTEENVIRMRTNEIQNRKNNRDRKIEELNDKLNMVDIIFTPLVYGIIE